MIKDILTFLAFILLPFFSTLIVLAFEVGKMSGFYILHFFIFFFPLLILNSKIKSKDSLIVSLVLFTIFSLILTYLLQIFQKYFIMTGSGVLLFFILQFFPYIILSIIIKILSGKYKSKKN